MPKRNGPISDNERMQAIVDIAQAQMHLDSAIQWIAQKNIPNGVKAIQIGMHDCAQVLQKLE